MNVIILLALGLILLWLVFSGKLSRVLGAVKG